MDFRTMIFGEPQASKAPTNKKRIVVLCMVLGLMVAAAWYFGIIAPVVLGLKAIVVALWNMLCDFAAAFADFVRWVVSQRQ